jgi:hypothetical protein
MVIGPRTALPAFNATSAKILVIRPLNALLNNKHN